MMPARRIASITRVVATGRRMKSSAMFIAMSPAFALARCRAAVRPRGGRGLRRRRLHLDLAARLQPELALDDDLLAGLEALADDRLVAGRAPHLDRAHLDRLVVLDHEDVVAALPALHRLAR